MQISTSYTKSSAPDTFYAQDYVLVDTSRCATNTFTFKSAPTQVLGTVRSGSYLPNYRELIAQGLSATTGYSVVGRRYSRFPGSAEVDNGDYPCGVKQYPTKQIARYAGFDIADAPDFTKLSVAVTGPIMSQADNQALSQLSSALADKLSPFSGGVFAGELKETIGMLRHPMRGITDALTAYVKRPLGRTRFPKARSQRNKKLVLDAINDTYLNVVYGVNPLIRDIEDIKTVINKRYESRIVRVRGSGSAYGGDQMVESTVTNYFNLGTSCKLVIQRRAEAHTSWVGGIRVGGDEHPFTAQNLGLGLRNFVPTLWNLIPYSFVADYFTNIGDIVNNMSLPRNVLVWSSKSTVLKQSNTKTIRGRFANPLVKGTINCGGSNAELFEMVRTNMDTSYLAMPTLQFNLPSLKQFTNLSQLSIAHASSLIDLRHYR